LGKTVVVGVRIPENVKKEIEDLGFRVPAFVKEAVEEELKRRKSGNALDWIRANRVPGKGTGFDSVKVIRELRDAL
jgi:hypothetical protein